MSSQLHGVTSGQLSRIYVKCRALHQQYMSYITTSYCHLLQMWLKKVWGGCTHTLCRAGGDRASLAYVLPEAWTCWRDATRGMIEILSRIVTEKSKSSSNSAQICRWVKLRVAAWNTAVHALEQEE